MISQRLVRIGGMAAALCTAVSAAAEAAGVRCDIWYHTPAAQVEDTLAGDALQRPSDEVRGLPDTALVPAPAVPLVAAMRAWIHPAATGDYRFAIASDDSGVLLLSPDAGAARLTPVASNPSWSPADKFDWYESQQSAVIHLIAGHRYLFEAVMQNVSGGSHLRVVWTTPGRTEFQTVPGDQLEPLPSFMPLWVPPPRRPKSLVLGPDLSDAGHVAGFHPYVDGATARFGDGQTVTFSYLLFTPGVGAATRPVTQPSAEAIDEPPAAPTPRPLLIFLHGSSHQGKNLDGILNEGPAEELQRLPDLRRWFPMEALFPQLPDGWRWDTPGAAAMVNELVRQICYRYPEIDRSRIYLTGLSMGGKGTWLTAYDAPQLYAAVATFSAVAVRPTAAPRLLGGLPHVRIICGAEDGDFTKGSTEMDAALSPVLGDRLTFEAVPHEGHGVWGRFYPTREFYEDLLRYHREDSSLGTADYK